MDSRNLDAEEPDAEDSPEKPIISAIALFQKIINRALGFVNISQGPDLDALLNLTAASGSEEYGRFKTDLSYREKLDYLLDIVIYQILQKEMETTTKDHNNLIKKEIIKMMSSLPEAQQIPIDPDKPIKIGLQQRGFQHPADPTRMPIGMVIDVFLPKIKNEIVERLNKNPDDPRWSLVRDLVDLKQNVGDLSFRLQAERRAFSTSRGQLNQVIDEYHVSVEKLFKSHLNKLSKTERGKMLYILNAAIKADDPQKRQKEELLQKYFGSIKPIEPSNNPIPAPTQSFSLNAEAQAWTEKKILSAKYHEIVTEFGQLAALSDLKMKNSQEEVVFTEEVQNGLRNYVNQSILPKYINEAATNFFRKLSNIFKTVDAPLADQLMPLSDKESQNFESKDAEGKNRIYGPDTTDERSYKLDQFIREVEAYHNMREAEAVESGKHQESHYIKHFGFMPLGISAGVKLRASAELLAFLKTVSEGHDVEAPPLDKLEIKALKNGRLAKILEKYEDVLPPEFAKAMSEARVALPKPASL